MSLGPWYLRFPNEVKAQKCCEPRWASALQRFSRGLWVRSLLQTYKKYISCGALTCLAAETFVSGSWYSDLLIWCSILWRRGGDKHGLSCICAASVIETNTWADPGDTFLSNLCVFFTAWSQSDVFNMRMDVRGGDSHASSLLLEQQVQLQHLQHLCTLSICVWIIVFCSFCVVKHPANSM